MSDAVEEALEAAARAMMDVYARRPGDPNGLEYPVLARDPHWDDLPVDATEGTEDDEVTQEAVLKLVAAGIAAFLRAIPHLCIDIPDGCFEAEEFSAAVEAAASRRG